MERIHKLVVPVMSGNKSCAFPIANIPMTVKVSETRETGGKMFFVQCSDKPDTWTAINEECPLEKEIICALVVAEEARAARDARLVDCAEPFMEAVGGLLSAIGTYGGGGSVNEHFHKAREIFDMIEDRERER